MTETPTSIEKSDNLITLFGLCFVVFGWLALTLCLSNMFFSWAILLGLFSLSILLVLLGKKLFSLTSIDLKVITLISLCIALFIGYNTIPTLFSGRDQGSLSEASYRLAENHQLTFSNKASQSFFTLYGPGTALNFPGFVYTKQGELLTQFPLAYIAWLASFVSLFGLSGFTIANVLLLFLSLITFYSLLRIFVQRWYAFAGFLLFIGSFLPLWFAKTTLSENLALFLFLFLIRSLVLFLKQGKFISYASTLLAGGLFVFTRIEGFVFLFLILCLLLVNQKARTLWKTYPWKSIILPGIIFIGILLRDFFVNIPYYKAIGKALIKFLNGIFGTNIITYPTNTSSLHLESILFSYGLLIIFLIGLFSLIVLARKKYYLALLPAYIALPTFLYLFDPNISPDHPWMLRRYLFSLFPTLLFSVIVGLATLFAKTHSPFEKLSGKRLFFVTTLIASLLILQYPAWKHSILFSENDTLLKQTLLFSQQFSDTDLILVDREVTGDGFSMITGPAQYLTKKNIVYFFNPYDLTRLDTSSFSHIYLLTPEKNIDRYREVFGQRMAFSQSVLFSTQRFQLKTSDNSSFFTPLPQKITVETHNSLFQIY